MENRTDYGRYIQEFVLLVGIFIFVLLSGMLLVRALIKSF